MKTLILSLASFVIFHSSAQAELADGIPDEHVFQVVEMAGRPGTTARAALVRNQESGDLDFLIVETIAGRNYITVQNEKLGLSDVYNPRLSVNEAGSVLISSDNQAVPSRDMWSRTLTVSFRGNYFMFSGFTLNYEDTLKGKTFACDMNLLTGQGIRNGHRVPLSSAPIRFGLVEETEKFYSCFGW